MSALTPRRPPKPPARQPPRTNVLAAERSAAPAQAANERSTAGADIATNVPVKTGACHTCGSAQDARRPTRLDAVTLFAKRAVATPASPYSRGTPSKYALVASAPMRGPRSEAMQLGGIRGRPKTATASEAGMRRSARKSAHVAMLASSAAKPSRPPRPWWSERSSSIGSTMPPANAAASAATAGAHRTWREDIPTNTPQKHGRRHAGTIAPPNSPIALAEPTAPRLPLLST